MKSGIWKSLPYVSRSFPWDDALREAIEEREVDEADGRGESLGEPLAVEGEEKSASTAFEEVMVRRRTRFAGGVLTAVDEAILRKKPDGLGPLRFDQGRRGFNQ